MKSPGAACFRGFFYVFFVKKPVIPLTHMGKVYIIQNITVA